MAILSTLSAVGHYVPERIVTNEELSRYMSTSDAWIKERTGIHERRFVAEGQTTTDIAELAVENLLDRFPHVDIAEVDCIVAATLSPDFYFPGIGSLLQHRLSVPNVPAIDLRAQCSGFVYSLSVIDGLIKSKQYKKVLLVCAEVQSPVLELNDNGRDMAVLFGDAATAVLIERGEGDAESNVGIVASKLGSDGSGAESLFLPSPGTATPGFMNAEAFQSGAWHPRMDGRTVFKHAVSRLCGVAQEILQENNVAAETVDFVLPHQANLRINEMVREKLAFPSEKVLNNIQKYGNTTAATIPLLLSEAVQDGTVQRGDLLLSVAFGAGFTWGANLFYW